MRPLRVPTGAHCPDDLRAQKCSNIARLACSLASVTRPARTWGMQVAVDPGQSHVCHHL